VLGPENFCYARRLSWSVVVDVGVGPRPTFGHWIREQTGAFVVLCDPTPRHQAALREWIAAVPRTELVQAAVSDRDGEISFYESETQESGSIVPSHINRSTPGQLVTVAGVSVATLVALARRHGRVDLVKLDLEGAEFSVFGGVGTEDSVISEIPQWLVECHPAPQTDETFASVARVCRRFRRLGFEEFSPNGTDCLFWRR
jgi:FkbM family methyltransferase